MRVVLRGQILWLRARRIEWLARQLGLKHHLVRRIRQVGRLVGLLAQSLDFGLGMPWFEELNGCPSEGWLMRHALEERREGEN